MYYITHPYSSWSYKRAFTKFHDAFMVQQLVAPDAQIEFFDGLSGEIVWDPRWETCWC